MPAADLLTRPQAKNPASAVTAALAGWGGGPRSPATVIRPHSLDELRTAALDPLADGIIARGMGRAYGDAARLDGGLVIQTTALREMSLDAEAGTVTAQAGVTLAELLAFLQPAGWILPVVPGTQHVSLGGAIAADIHGKNHGHVGTFGSHVQALGLLTAAGDLLELAPDQDGDLLAATIGGMGLTGLIVWATVKLRPLRSAWLSVDTDRFQRLDDALALLDGPGGTHRVAWLDLLSRRLVRGVVTRADHLVQAPPERAEGSTTVRARATVPPRWPGGILRPSAVQAFNELRYRRTPGRQVGHVESFGAHMFPLDVLNAWPRLYGPSGLVQYQFVVPRGQEPAVEELLVRMRRSSVPCYLAVLKDFGPENHAPLSFPIAGWTVALDMPRAAPGLETLMRGFDELVAGAGGRVYLAKDWRLRADVLAAMYPRLEQWRGVRDQIDPERRWRSDLGLRTGLVQA